MTGLHLNSITIIIPIILAKRILINLRKKLLGDTTPTTQAGVTIGLLPLLNLLTLLDLVPLLTLLIGLHLIIARHLILRNLIFGTDRPMRQILQSLLINLTEFPRALLCGALLFGF